MGKAWHAGRTSAKAAWIKHGHRLPCSVSVSCVTCACEAVGAKFASGVRVCLGSVSSCCCSCAPRCPLVSRNFSSFFLFSSQCHCFIFIFPCLRRNGKINYNISRSPMHTENFLESSENQLSSSGTFSQDTQHCRFSERIR